MAKSTCLLVTVCWLCTSGSSGAQEPRSSPQPNLRGGAFQRVIERMWRDSPTLREQCARVAAERQLSINIRADRPLFTDVRARSQISIAKDGRVLRADTVLMWLPDTIELIGHEIEHVIESMGGRFDRSCRDFWIQTATHRLSASADIARNHHWLAIVRLEISFPDPHTNRRASDSRSSSFTRGAHHGN